MVLLKHILQHYNSLDHYCRNKKVPVIAISTNTRFTSVFILKLHARAYNVITQNVMRGHITVEQKILAFESKWTVK